VSKSKIQQIQIFGEESFDIKSFVIPAAGDHGLFPWGSIDLIFEI
jgi:hypothetical protein